VDWLVAAVLLVGNRLGGPCPPCGSHVLQGRAGRAASFPAFIRARVIAVDAYMPRWKRWRGQQVHVGRTQPPLERLLARQGVREGTIPSTLLSGLVKCVPWAWLLPPVLSGSIRGVGSSAERGVCCCEWLFKMCTLKWEPSQ
jgi:hypothetical protein